MPNQGYAGAVEGLCAVRRQGDGGFFHGGCDFQAA